MIVVKNIECKLCPQTVNIVNKRDAEGFAVTTGWEHLRDHWDNEHPEEMERLQIWLDGDLAP